MPSERPTTVVESLGIGRALVVDSDPDGNRAVHERRKTRLYEILHEVGVITDDHRTACELFRDNWIVGRLTQDLKAGGHIYTPKGDKAAAAWERHQRCLNAMGAGSGLVLQAMVLHDEPLTNIGQRMAKPLARLENALDALVNYCDKGHLDIPH